MARTRRSRLYVAAMTVLIAAGAIYWFRNALTSSPEPATVSSTTASITPAGGQPKAAAADPVAPSPAMQRPAAVPTPVAVAATQRAASSEPAAAAANDSAGASAVLTEAAAGIAGGNLVQARRVLNQAASATADSPTNEQIVQQLVKLADETLFSSRILQNDPLVLRHVIAAKENLQKIANTYKITVPLICRINNLSNPNKIRQGQPLKVINGPFHAVVCKRTFRISLYCQDTLVKVFPVALGAEGTTPTGSWRLKNKLSNPTYYPPRGGAMVAPDDPNNPLGEFWMGLEGVEGEAVGQERYGIHGTNEPDKMGQNVSLGCIRLRNEDAAQVYEMLVVRDSLVTVKD